MLLLVTAGFPYGKGEQFLEAEIPILAERFKEVSVVPLAIDGDSRQLPSGVRVDSRYADARFGRLGRLRIAAAFAKSLLRSDTWNELRRVLGGPVRTGSDRLAPALVEWIRSSYRAELFGRYIERLAATPSHVYFYWFVPEVLGAIRHCRTHGAQDRPRVVTRAHGSDLFEVNQATTFFGYRSLVMSAIDRVFPVSRCGASHLERGFPDSRERIELAWLGVRPSERLNAQPDAGLEILTICSSAPEKRQDRIAEIIGQLGRRLDRVSIRWTHVGDAPVDPRAVDAIGRFPTNVSFEMKGRMSNAEVLRVLTDTPFDLILNASDIEGVPVSIMEAFAAGIPAVAPNVGGMADLFEFGAGHLLAADAPVEAYVDAMAAYVDKRASREWRQRAISTWRARFQASSNFSAFCDRLVDLRC